MKKMGIAIECCECGAKITPKALSAAEESIEAREFTEILFHEKTFIYDNKEVIKKLFDALLKEQKEKTKLKNEIQRQANLKKDKITEEQKKLNEKFYKEFIKLHKEWKTKTGNT